MLIKPKHNNFDRAEMVKFIVNNPKVTLEVGCREGLFSNKMKERFSKLKTWGIEPADDINIENANKNLDVFINDFLTKDTDLPQKHFDLISFNDVLEHMYDPWDMLIHCRENLLSENGMVLASIPNVRHKNVLKKLVFNDLFEYKDAGILDVTHIRFFTETTIKKMFEDTGYEIVSFDYLTTKKMKLRKKIFNFLTRNKFYNLDITQFAIVAKPKVL